MASIGLASDVELLFGVLGELLEKEREKSVYVLASCHSVAHGATTVRVADVHGLVEEDHGSIAVPRVRVGFDLGVFGDGGRSKLHKESGK
jgi:hypothetical protein